MADRWPALLTRKEAAEYLGVSPSTLSQLISMGRIRGVKLFTGGHPKYKRLDLDELIESLEYVAGFCAATQSY